MFQFFIRNDLISWNQSGFKPDDSCINQLLAIIHEIYKSFDACLDRRAMFLDISKAFDRVWHLGLYKLKQNGISGNLLETLTDFLKDQKRRVVMNMQNSSWANVEDGILEGSILGPLLFLIYINDLSENLSTSVKLFADDTFSVVHDIATSSCDLNYDLNRVREWALLTIYKCFVRSHLDYGNIIYYQPNNSLHQKIGSLQYNAALAITGAIRKTSREKVYQELSLEPLQPRLWYRKCLFFKMFKNQSPKYLFDIIPQSNCQYRTRNVHTIPHINVKQQFFKNTYFTSTITEWNKIDSNIRN